MMDMTNSEARKMARLKDAQKVIGYCRYVGELYCPQYCPL
jgi:hypothetical protein